MNVGLASFLFYNNYTPGCLLINKGHRSCLTHRVTLDLIEEDQLPMTEGRPVDISGKDTIGWMIYYSRRLVELS